MVTTRRQSTAAAQPAAGFFGRHDNVFLYVPNLIGAWSGCSNAFSGPGDGACPALPHVVAAAAVGLHRLAPPTPVPAALLPAGYARVAAAVLAFAVALRDPLLTVGAYFASFVCDELDGRFARKLNQSSTFGAGEAPGGWAPSGGAGSWLWQSWAGRSGRHGQAERSVAAGPAARPSRRPTDAAVCALRPPAPVLRSSTCISLERLTLAAPCAPPPRPPPPAASAGHGDRPRGHHLPAGGALRHLPRPRAARAAARHAGHRQVGGAEGEGAGA